MAALVAVGGAIAPVAGAQVPVSPVAPQSAGGINLLLRSAESMHPSIRSAQATLASSELDIDAAKRRRWPTVSAVLESSSGNAGSYPSRSVQVEQALWDGGRVSALISQAEAGRSLSRSRVEVQRQQLNLQVVAAWQLFLSASDRIRIAEASLVQLRGYEAQMRRRVAANASPQIDLELVLSRTRQAEVDLTGALTSRRVALTRMVQLTGLDPETIVRAAAWPDRQSLESGGVRYGNLDLSEQARQAAAVNVARGEVEITKAQLEGKRSERYPTVYARLNQPMGRTAPGVDNSTSLFIGMRYTPGAGFATGIEADALAARVQAAEQTTESAYLDAFDAMNADREEAASATRRMGSLNEALEGSQLVLESYSRQFTAGRKTWIDLLNAVRELSQNQLGLAEAQSAAAAALYRLQIRLGEVDLIP